MQVLVLGGYGFFGTRIVRLLAREPGLEVLVAGRHRDSAQALVHALPDARARLSAVGVDIRDRAGLARLLATQPTGVVIHTCGPFQGQDHAVAKACLAAGWHYLDLADGRTFVSGITALDAEARARGVLVASGCSSVPGLSGAVVAALAARLDRLDTIDIGISPGNRTDRGLATVKAILSYGGEAIPAFRDGRPVTVRGWGATHRHRYAPPVGTRWLADCDVPDHVLLPARYPGVREVRFRAGLELPVLHFGMMCLALLRRLRLLPNLSRLAVPLKRISEWFLPFGSDHGAMHVTVSGADRAGTSCRLAWELDALHGDGPYVPALCSVALTLRIARGQPVPAGAMAAPAGATLDEILAVAEGLAIRTTLTETEIP